MYHFKRFRFKIDSRKEGMRLGLEWKNMLSQACSCDNTKMNVDIETFSSNGSTIGWVRHVL
jgi:hypothetical protein